MGMVAVLFNSAEPLDPFNRRPHVEMGEIGQAVSKIHHFKHVYSQGSRADISQEIKF